MKTQDMTFADVRRGDLLHDTREFLLILRRTRSGTLTVMRWYAISRPGRYEVLDIPNPNASKSLYTMGWYHLWRSRKP